MLGKSYADIVNITNSFLTIRLPRYDIASEFFLKLTCLPYIFYMETCITYNTMLFCSVLISLNRFIAIKYPMNYQFWFSTKMMKYYFAGIFIISISIGYVVLSYEPYYQRLGEENGYFVGFKNKNVGIFTACYTLALYLPCAILAVSLNVITAFELKKYRKQLSSNVKKEIHLFFYSIVNLIAFLIFFLYFLFRSLHIIFYLPMLQMIAILSIQWIIDIQSFGLFFSSLIICSPLRDMIFLRKIDDTANLKKTMVSKVNIISCTQK